MKRLLACILTMSALCVSPGTTAGAYEPSGAPQPEAQLLNRELYRDKSVETYQIVTSDQGAYAELSDFSMEREAGTTITVNGVWKPYFPELTLEFYADDGTATLGFLRSGEHNVFHLNSSSVWHLHIRSENGLAVEEGTLQLTILKP